MKTLTIPTAPFTIGDRVRYSANALRPKRDYWLGCGQHSQKDAAKAELERDQAKRGAVLSCERGKYGWGVVVQFDGEPGTHNALPYLFEKV